MKAKPNVESEYLLKGGTFHPQIPKCIRSIFKQMQFRHETQLVFVGLSTAVYVSIYATRVANKQQTKATNKLFALPSTCPFCPPRAFPSRAPLAPLPPASRPSLPGRPLGPSRASPPLPHFLPWPRVPCPRPAWPLPLPPCMTYSQV